MDKKDMQTAGEKWLTVPYINQSTVTECGEEFTLPDYYPEIKKVVTTLCRVLPEALYDSGDLAEQGGVVAFTVLYLGDDGSLTSAPLTCDFTAAVQLPKTDDRRGTVIFADTVVESVSCRCAGPRKLILRARLRMTVTGDKQTSAEPEITDTLGGSTTVAEKISVQTAEKEYSTMRRAGGRITGSISGELRERPGTKPVMCDGEIIVNEASLSDGTVTIRGDAVMWCICFSDDGLYYKATARAPFEEKLTLDGADLAGGSARGHGRCAAVSVKEQDDGTLLWDMEYDLECEAAENIAVTVAKDMYSTEYEANVISGDCDLLSMAGCTCGRLSLNGSSGRSGSVTIGDYIIGSFGKATCDKIEKNGTRLVLSGSAEVRVLVCGDGDVAEECVRIPYKYECDCHETGEGDLFWRCDVGVSDCTARLDGDRINVTAELSLSVFAGQRNTVEHVQKLEMDRERKCSAEEGVIRIYYPSAGETAWDITKKYRIPKNAVTEVTADGVLIE